MTKVKKDAFGNREKVQGTIFKLLTPLITPSHESIAFCTPPGPPFPRRTQA